MNDESTRTEPQPETYPEKAPVLPETELFEEDEPLFPESPDKSDPSKPPPKEEGAFRSAFLTQAILSLILAITVILGVTFAPEPAREFLALVRKTAKNDFSFREDLERTAGELITYLNQIEPIQRTEADPDETSSASSQPEESSSEPAAEDPSSGGQGGDFTPASSGSLPENVTFAPVVYIGSLTFPLKNWRQTSEFGFRDHPTKGEPEFHKAADFAAAQGEKIFAVADGIVTVSEESGALGKHLVIDHGNEFFTVYGHCDRLIAQKGTRVRAGDVIARVGSTGDSTGSHLHFAAQLQGLYFNPAYLFPEKLHAAF